MMLEKIKKNLFLFIFWFIPLLLGITSFIGWLITGFDFFMYSGMITIYIGISAVLIGTFILIIIWMQKKGNKLFRKFLIIASNIPVALIIAYISITLLTVYNLKIQNNSDSIVTNCIIEGGGVYIEIKEIEEYEIIKKRLWIETDGSLKLYYTKDREDNEILIEGYVTSGLGGNKTIVIQ